MDKFYLYGLIQNVYSQLKNNIENWHKYIPWKRALQRDTNFMIEVWIQYEY